MPVTETSILLYIGESGQQSSCKEFNEDPDQTDDHFSLGFINSDPNENFIDDGNMDEYSSSPSFEVVEEVKVNHGLFVSTRQVAETFFHQLVPSQTVQVHLNPVLLLGNNFLVERANPNSRVKSETSTEDSLLSPKFKAFAKAKLVEMTKSMKFAWWTLLTTIICTIALLLTSEEHIESEKTMDDFASSAAGVEGNEDGCADIFKKRKRRIGIKLCNEKGKVSVVNIRGGSNFTVFLKKIGIFLTISLALCTMWANHNMIITT